MKSYTLLTVLLPNVKTLMKTQQQIYSEGGWWVEVRFWGSWKEGWVGGAVIGGK